MLSKYSYDCRSQNYMKMTDTRNLWKAKGELSYGTLHGKMRNVQSAWHHNPWQTHAWIWHTVKPQKLLRWHQLQNMTHFQTTMLFTKSATLDLTMHCLQDYCIFIIHYCEYRNWEKRVSFKAAESGVTPTKCQTNY